MCVSPLQKFLEVCFWKQLPVCKYYLCGPEVQDPAAGLVPLIVCRVHWEDELDRKQVESKDKVAHQVPLVCSSPCLTITNFSEQSLQLWTMR